MYLPRTLGAKDDILNEDDLPFLLILYEVEMYVKNVDGFEGEGDFLSKFGLQIRDSITMSETKKKMQKKLELILRLIDHVKAISSTCLLTRRCLLFST